MFCGKQGFFNADSVLKSHGRRASSDDPERGNLYVARSPSP